EHFSLPAPAKKINPMGRMLSNRGATLLELSRCRPVLVVFLRHSGCTFCHEAVADIAEQREKIEALGTQIAIVHLGQKEPADLLARHQLCDLHIFRDPSCSLYDTFGLSLASFMQILGPSIWWRGIVAALKGHRVGGLEGNVFRMPGVFLLHEGRIVRAYRHQSAADRPDYAAMATLPPAEPKDACDPQPTAS
ncbi:MAG: redoxin domain-containing protein, partial [Planctomycetaceae bacterium]|nr:redoxin domain-containing protein [Planctomycetaceae bacterium]